MIRNSVFAIAVVVSTQPAAADPTCAGGERIERFDRSASGSDAVACFSGWRGGDRSCWRVDAKGTVTALPEKQWPAAEPAHVNRGDRPQPVVIDNVPTYLPAKLTAKLSNEYDQPATVDICEGNACRHVQLRAQKKERTSLQAMYSITVLPDRRTMYVGLGLGTTAAEALERYDLDNPKVTPQKLAVGASACADILDTIGGNMIVQITDCANAGGDRVIMTTTGKRLAKIDSSATDAPYYALGGERTLFVGFHGMAIWDIAKAKQLVAIGEDAMPEAVAVLGERIFGLSRSGELTAYDTALKPTKLAGIPRCKK